MYRNVLGALLALIGAAVALISPFRDWYGSRAGQDIRLQELFTTGALTDTNAALFSGMFLAMLIVAVLAVIGVLLFSRMLVALAGVVALGITILWMVRQYQINDSLVVGGNGVDIGALGALAAGVLLLLGAAVMAGRRRGHAVGHAPAAEGPDEGRVVDGPWDSGTKGDWDDAQRRDAA